MAELTPEQAKKLAEFRKAKAAQSTTKPAVKPTVKKPGYVDPTDPSVKKEIAGSKPSTKLSPQEYQELAALYEKAKLAKVGPEVEAFQKRYHELLPDEAKRIIAKHPVRTKKAIKEGRTAYDLEGNVDGYFGDRTEQYWQSVQDIPRQKMATATEEEGYIDPATGAIVSATSNENPLIAEHAQPGIPTDTRAPWWIQDILKEGYAAGNLLNQQAFYPWQAPSNVYLPDMTFYDPERELAANAETTRIGAEQAAAFADPQAFAANFAGIQGAATKNAADILGKYNNLNVGIANQQEAQNAGLLTQASQRKAQEQTSLWDKYQTVNQNLFNSKKAATQQLVDQTAKGITNAANTYNLNQMYPNYAIDPWSGGQFHFQNPKEMRPGQHTSTAMEKYQKMLKDNPTFDNEKGRQQLLDILKLDMGLPTGNMDEYERAQLNKGITPGYGG